MRLYELHYITLHLTSYHHIINHITSHRIYTVFHLALHQCIIAQGLHHCIYCSLHFHNMTSHDNVTSSHRNSHRFDISYIALHVETNCTEFALHCITDYIALHYIHIDKTKEINLHCIVHISRTHCISITSDHITSDWKQLETATMSSSTT